MEQVAAGKGINKWVNLGVAYLEIGIETVGDLVAAGAAKTHPDPWR
jgi:hypothetical protein